VHAKIEDELTLEEIAHDPKTRHRAIGCLSANSSCDY